MTRGPRRPEPAAEEPSTLDPQLPPLLGRMSRQLGGARWAACWHDGQSWRVTSSAGSLRDELLLRLAGDGVLTAELDGTPVWLETVELGAVGRRLSAGGVHTLLVTRHHAGALSVFENPKPRELVLPRDDTDRTPQDPLAGEAALRELRMLAAWQPLFDDLAGGRRPLQEVLDVLRQSGGPVLAAGGADDEGRMQIRTVESRGTSPETLAVVRAVLRRCVLSGPGDGIDNAMLRERARLASVIHEGITQSLTTVALQLDTLGFVLEAAPEEAAGMVTAARAAVVDALDGLRSIIVDLTPPENPWTDLVGGLRRFAADYGAQWETAVNLQVSGDPRPIDAQVTSLVFAVVQEGLTNVRKHTRATSADVLVHFDVDRLVVEISDQGAVGAVPAPDPGLRSHQGLAIMRSRARLLGGRVEFSTEPGRGSTLWLSVPA